MFENTQGSLNQVMQARAVARISERRASSLPAAFILRAGRRQSTFVREGVLTVGCFSPQGG
jgi:hypothetical protein